jgi:precorrin-6A/cobalt-precorrin-6A reductase
MPVSAELLLLGGTGEARTLAARLAELPRLRVVSSLAGRVRDPRLPVGEVRIGGFGGAAGLTDYLRAHQVRAVVDATHPFAQTISAHAAVAAAQTGTPLLVLRRPPYESRPSWRRVTDVAAAAAAISRPGAVWLTTGRRDLGAFAGDATRHYVVRTVDEPGPPLPARHTLLADRGPWTVAGERALIAAYGIETLVTKDSGGSLTLAKLAAAQVEGLDVLVVDRPPLPAGSPRPVADVDAAFAWCAAL